MGSAGHSAALRGDTRPQGFTVVLMLLDATPDCVRSCPAVVEGGLDGRSYVLELCMLFWCTFGDCAHPAGGDLLASILAVRI